MLRITAFARIQILLYLVTVCPNLFSTPIQSETKLFHLITQDHIKLHSMVYQQSPESPNPEVVVYLTGQGDAASMYRYLAIHFQDHFKRDVILFDHRGQGQSSGKRCHVDHYDDYVNDLHLLLSTLQSKYQKIHLVCHSMGALIASLYSSSTNFDYISSLTLIAPYFSLAGPQLYRKFADQSSYLVSSWFGYGDLKVSPFNPAVYLSSQSRNIITTNPNYFDIFNGHPDKCGVPSFSWVQASFEAQRRIQTLNQKIKPKVLMLTAGNDQVVSTPVANETCLRWQKQGIATCSYVEYEGKKHGLIYETEAVMSDIFARIKNHVETN